MRKLFDLDNPLWDAMGRIFDVFVLNCLWLLCCLPLFTVGPSTTALFYAMTGLIRGDGGYVSRDFFRSFGRNFRQGILLGLPLTAVGAFLAADILLCRRAGTGIYSFFLFFFLVLFLLWLSLFLYVFPLLARFDRRNRDLLLWAFTLCIRHFPRTLAMILILTAAVWACTILPGLIFIAFGLAAEGMAALLTPVLAPYLPPVWEEE